MSLQRQILFFAILLFWIANPAAQAQTSTFSLTVSPNPIVFAAGTSGSGTVTVAPSAGFSGSVSLACATGAPVSVAGYSCVFSPATVALSGVSTTSALSLTPIATTAGAVNTARLGQDRKALLRVSLATSLLLLGLFGMARRNRQIRRNFLLLSGFTVATLSGLSACGGGGGSSGGGQVSTTTTLSSSNLHVGFGTGVTFSITVTPNGNATPSGQVQLYDNGQPLGQSTQVSAGVASFLAASLPVGVNTITAQYLGDAHTLPSTSAPIVQLIAGTVTMQLNGTSGSTAESANFTVNVL